MARRRSFLLVAIPLALAALLAAFLRTRDRAPATQETAAPAAAASPTPRAGAARALGRIDPAVPITVPRAAPAPLPGAAGAFEGRVVSARDGEGIPGAEISFSLGAALATTTSGPGGAFRLVPPVSGRWRLAVVTAAGHLPFAPEWGHSPVLLDARPGAEVRGVTVTLAPAVAYVVEVVDAKGGAVEGAELRVLGAGAGETALLPLRERYRTDAAGEARVVAPADALIEASAPGRGGGRGAVDFAARVSGRLRIRLDGGLPAAATSEIRGRVELPGGAPAEEALVVAWTRAQDEELPRQQAVAGAGGEFLLTGLDPGTYALTARAPGFAPAHAPAVRAGGPPVTLSLRDGGRVEGRVVARGSGRPVVPFTVAARRRAGSWAEPIQSLAVFDAEGRFALDGLPAGRVFLFAAAPGHAPAGPVEVEVPAPGAGAATVELVLDAGATVHGVVRRRGTGAPLAGVEVTVEGEASGAASAVPLRGQVATGDDGRFEATGLPARAVSLFFFAPGHHGRIVAVPSLRDGERRGPIEVELTPVAAGETPDVELTGIGAVLTQDGSLLRVQRVADGGGASAAGLAAGDVVVRIDGREVSGLDLASAVSLIRGPEGSTVALDVRRGGDAAREVRLVVERRVVRG